MRENEEILGPGPNFVKIVKRFLKNEFFRGILTKFGYFSMILGEEIHDISNLVWLVTEEQKLFVQPWKVGHRKGKSVTYQKNPEPEIRHLSLVR